MQSEENFSDEELIVTADNIEEVLKTRIGSGPRRQQDLDGKEAGEENDAHIPESSKEAFQNAQALWKSHPVKDVYQKHANSTISQEALEMAIAAAKISQKNEWSGNQGNSKEKEPVLKEVVFSTRDVWAWYEHKRNLKDANGKPAVRKAQLEMLHVICNRVCDELEDASNETQFKDPLMWLLHGTPGTGKSEVLLMAKELFTDVCGWSMGAEYQMVALQAVMAQLLGGDTIHHAVGINPFHVKQDTSSQQKNQRKQSDVAKRVMRWRWLFIDEISMVSAKLLAEVDMKLRAIMSDVGSMKRGRQGQIRAFGGINIVFVGDFWQLEPPRGGFIADIPVEFIRRGRKYNPKPDIAHGQAIFWHYGKGSVQGITELTECVRTEEDPWLLQVQNEMRRGDLTLNSWQFLHGFDTEVPGSWVNGDLSRLIMKFKKYCLKLVSSFDPILTP
jgi:DNA replication protein DnaC